MAGITTDRVPVEKSVVLVIALEENVMLCAMPSLFVKSTVAPGATFIARGLNAMFLSDTLVVGTGPGGGVVIPDE